MSDTVRRKLQDNPVVVLITALASLTAVVGFVMTCGDRRSAAVDPCEDVIGQWDWLLTGGLVSIAAGGTATWRTTNDATAPNVQGSWSCDERTEQIQLRWATGFTDDLELSDDGARLAGQNRRGDSISASRMR